VNWILLLLAIVAISLSQGCEWFGPAEKHKTDEGRTTYRSAAENPNGEAVTPLPQRVPGESRKTNRP